MLLLWAQSADIVGCEVCTGFEKRLLDGSPVLEFAAPGGLEVKVGELDLKDSALIVDDEEHTAIAQGHGEGKVFAFWVEEVVQADLIVFLLELLVVDQCWLDFADEVMDEAVIRRH